jgi:hypothetical protein
MRTLHPTQHGAGPRRGRGAGGGRAVAACALCGVARDPRGEVHAGALRVLINVRTRAARARRHVPRADFDRVAACGAAGRACALVALSLVFSGCPPWAPRAPRLAPPCRPALLRRHSWHSYPAAAGRPTFASADDDPGRLTPALTPTRPHPQWPQSLAL